MARQMKDSGVEWIGQIPENWKIGRVKNVFDRKNEKAQQEDPVILSLARAGVKVRDVSTGEGQIAESYYNYNPVKEGDLLLNPMDLYSGANCSVSKVSGVISPAYINLRAKGNNNSTYYDYYFKTQYWAMAMFAHGKGVSFDNRWTLNAETLFNYYVPIPSEEEQEKIANFLDEKVKEIDNVIETTKATIEDYKKYKQSVITEAVTKGLNPDVEMKDSGIDYIGLIPERWKIIPIGIAFDFIGGYAYKSEKFCDETANQVIRLGNVKNDNFILNEKQVFIDDEYAKESAQALIKVDDILFTMTGTKGKGDYFYTLIVKEEHLKNKKLFLNQRVGCFRKSINDVYMSYYDYLLKYDKIRDYIFFGETGSANQGNIGIEYINTLKLQFPDYDEQKEIANYLDEKCIEIDNLISAKEQLIADMESYKKSLIYEYVTGKKEVE